MADWYLLAGDEAALPAIAASLERIPAGRPVLAVLIVDGPDCRLALDCPGDLRITWVHRADHARDPDHVVRAVEGLDFPDGRVHVFVHGEASEVRAVRKHLLGARGLPRDGASISPYWRRNHTDEAWRSVKRQWLIDSEGDV